MKFNSKKSISFLFTGLGLSLCSHPVLAQDLRKVVEPTTPAVCQVLQATNQDSTTLIQNALNKCAQGKAVKLTSNKTNTVFISGPLNIPSNRNLIIDQNVILKATTNAKAFDNGSKTCGTLAKTGNGCNALITFDKVSNSGIYGAGIIDGQGGSKIAGSANTWWNLATQAKNSPNM